MNVAPFPGVSGRLLITGGRREDLAAYGGYSPIVDPDAFLDDVEAANLRGRGGAGFPLARKIRAVRASGGPAVVVANGEEGEPASVKDRWLLRHRPHLVLDGLRLAAALTGADEVHAYVADDESARSLEHADAERPGPGLRLTEVEHSYVAGEETALVRAVNGGPARPTDKPPRPFASGIGGRPTLVSNVETLSHLALLHRGAPVDTFLLSLSGTAAAGLFEVPLGTTLREVLTWRGADPDAIAGVLMGGYFGGVLSRRALDLPLDFDAVRAAGSGLGCGAIGLLPAGRCPVGVVASVMAYFATENAGQCGSCFNGTAAMSVALRALAEHRAAASDVLRLRNWSRSLRGRGACGTLDGAALAAASLLREFPAVVDAHLAGPCGTCGDTDLRAYTLTPPSAARKDVLA